MAIDFKSLILNSCSTFEVDCEKYGKFFLKTLSAAETMILSKMEDEYVRERIIVRALVNEVGERVFGDDDVKLVSEKVANPLINKLTAAYSKQVAVTDEKIADQKKT